MELNILTPPRRWMAVGRGGAIHALHSILSRREGFGVTWRTCPTTFYIKERLHDPIILARKVCRKSILLPVAVQG